MIENAPTNKTQEREGPWRKMTPYVDTKNQVHERYLGLTGAERFDAMYGEGNWDFVEGEFEAENEAERETIGAENRLASEGLRNVIASNMTADHMGVERLSTEETYRDDEGNRLSHRVQRRTAAPRKGHLVVSPDGDAHFAEYKKRMGIQ